MKGVSKQVLFWIFMIILIATVSIWFLSTWGYRWAEQFLSVLATLIPS